VELSVVDLSLLLREVAPKMAGCRIRNVYQLGDDSFVVALRSRGETLEFHVAPGECVFVSTKASEKPPKPSRLAAAFRSHMRGAEVEELSQVSGERILEMKMRRGEARLTLTMELLPRGNMLLLGPEGDVLTAVYYRRMRDRVILPKTRYRPPPLKKSLLLQEDVNGFLSDQRQRGHAIAAVLATKGGMGGRYSEELLWIAQLDPKKKVSSLTEEERSRLQKSLLILTQNLKNPEPVLATSPEGEAVALPYEFPSLRVRDYTFTRTESFNEAVARAKAVNDRLSALRRREDEAMARARYAERTLAEKERAISEVEEKAASLRREAQTMLSNAHSLEEIMATVKRRKDSGLGWEEAWSGTALPPSVKLERFRPDNRIATLQFHDVRIELDLGLSVASQASSKYEEAKKLERASQRIRDQLEESRGDLLRLQKDLIQREPYPPKPVRRQKPSRWHERFRWFHASTGELVVGGRDERSNEALVSHHLDKNDMVFHAEILGAPIVIVKTSGKPSREALTEAAQFAASYSRAWREGLGSMSVYYVKPDQISRSAPTGEYLPKGSFFVRGKRNYVKTELKIAIGLSREDEQIKVVSGPPEAVARITPRYVEVTPGRTPAEKLAGRIVALLLSEEIRETAGEVRQRLLQEVRSTVPYGKGSLTGTQQPYIRKDAEAAPGGG